MATFTITRDNTTLLSSPLTVNLAVGGTATFGTDYTASGADTFTATTATITIPAGQLSANIIVTPISDLTNESDETVILSIVPAVGISQTGTNSSATFTILNDDFAVTDPLFASVVLLMPLNIASGITDLKGKSAINQGVSLSTTILDPFGQTAGVISFPGAGARIVVNSIGSDLAFGNDAFAIEFWAYPTAFPSGPTWGIMDVRSVPSPSDWVVGSTASGNIGFLDFSYTTSPYYEPAPVALTLNQWQYCCISRSASGFHKIWVNGSLLMIASTRNTSITTSGNLLIGDLIDSAPPYDGSFTGYMSNVRITRAYRDGSIVPTAQFPTS